MIERKDTKYLRSVFFVNDVNKEDFVIVEYDSNWWLAQILELNELTQELHVLFLHPRGPQLKFAFPNRRDELLIPVTSVVAALREQPKKTGRRDQKYELSVLQMNDINTVFESF
ncbi:unnamed protein product [Didymodactylos carnosus]|uniref:Uncharacterized protein n=2 Tax=Didymodactylos carnosus TaxID=1234261 RepID=A0A814YAE8_9BILA|nr:unnamed protein product [Didymodactylos carnosus]CAF3989527.1 unnamed protein product [Didymodactylos carnosus]